MNWLTKVVKAEKALGPISNYFNLGTIISFKRAGGSNCNFYIKTDSGNYVFKIIIEYTLHDFKSSIIYLKRLKKYKFPASYYIKTSSGSSIYSQNNLVAIAMPLLPGKEPKPTQEINRAIGNNLARLHKIPSHSLPSKNSWINRDYMAKGIKILQKNVEKEKLKDTIREYKMNGNFDFSLFPQGIVHGDASPENCLYVGERLSAIVDWDDVAIGVLILDFAMTALKFCFTNNGFKPKLFKALKEGYCEIRPFSEKENKHFEEAIKYAGLIVSVWRNLQYNVYYPDKTKEERYKAYWSEWGLHKRKLLFGL